MKLDNLFGIEFKKLDLKKVRLKSDPAKPILPYEGYILGEAPTKIHSKRGMFPIPATVTPLAPEDAAPKPPEFAKKTTMGQKTGGFLAKVGQTYQDLEKGAGKFKELGQGNLGILKDLGVSMLQKQLDLDTNKVSVFGTKGYDLVVYTLTEQHVVENVDTILNKLISFYEAAPVDLRPGAIFGDYTDVIVVDRKTGVLRKAKPDEIPPIKIPNPPKPPKKRKPKPKPTPQPEPEEIKPKTRTVKLLLKIVKKDNLIQAGVPYVLIPANEETKKAMEQKNLSYAKFVKHVYTESQVENASILDNSGQIHFYNLQNQYVPEYTEDVNFVYKAPYYVMGTSAPRQVTIILDPAKDKTATTTPASSNTPKTKPGTPAASSTTP